MKMPDLSKIFRKRVAEDYMVGPEGANPDEVLRKHDIESRNRVISGHWMTFVTVVSIIFVSYHLITSRFGTPTVMAHRAIHVGFILFLTFCYYPTTQKSNMKRPDIFDTILMALTVLASAYTAWNIVPLALRASRALPMDYFVGGIMILLVLEACRRVAGKGLLVLAIIALLYVYFGAYIPGALSHRGYSISRIIYQMYLTGQGIYGTAIGISASYLIVFVIFGAVLEVSGLAKLFNDLALSTAGRLAGGPAKVAVVASALMGMISGSAATNVATTGAFSIPLMKKVGYRPYFAGAVEAAASTGGQIMPPVMGTAAFIMAEYLGVRYSTIALAAIIPAVLYFAGVYFQVDLRAKKMGMRGLSKDEMPDALDTVKNYGHMIVPMIVLVYLMMDGFSPIYAAFYAILTALVLAMIRKSTRIGLKDLKKIAVSAAKGSLSVGVAMATAGFIVGAMSMTGVGVVLADSIVALSNGNLLIALLMTMVVAIILGMGLPTSACYIVAASIAVPILTKMGVAPFQAHFFVFYYSVISTVTPPVALASYVGAGMAGAPPGKVGWAAFKLALAAFIVPFFFIYNPAMLLIADSWVTIAWAAVTALFGTFLLAVSMEGYLLLDLPFWTRILFFIAAIGLMMPGLTSDLVGLGVLVICIITIYVLRKNKKSGTPVEQAAENGVGT